MSSYLRNRKNKPKFKVKSVIGYISVKACHKGPHLEPLSSTFFVNDFCWLFIEEMMANYVDDNSLCVIMELLLDLKCAFETETEKSIRWFEDLHFKVKRVTLNFSKILTLKTYVCNMKVIGQSL